MLSTVLSSLQVLSHGIFQNNVVITHFTGRMGLEMGLNHLAKWQS